MFINEKLIKKASATNDGLMTKEDKSHFDNMYSYQWSSSMATGDLNDLSRIKNGIYLLNLWGGFVNAPTGVVGFATFIQTGNPLSVVQQTLIVSNPVYGYAHIYARLYVPEEGGWHVWQQIS